MPIMLLFGPSNRTAGTEEEGFSGSEQGVLSLLTSFDLLFSFLFFPDLWLIYCRCSCCPASIISHVTP